MSSYWLLYLDNKGAVVAVFAAGTVYTASAAKACRYAGEIMKRSWSLQALEDHSFYKRGKDQSLLDLWLSIDRALVFFRYLFTARIRGRFFVPSEAAKQETGSESARERRMDKMR